MNVNLIINFDNPKLFDPKNFSDLGKVCGLYFIFLTARTVEYPFKESKLIYIGMSEKRTNSIASRLGSHFDGTSKNIGLTNFRKVDSLRFTYLNFDVLKTFWSQRIEDLESFFIQDFVKEYGVYPICNNKTGFPDFDLANNSPLEIDWAYFSR